MQRTSAPRYAGIPDRLRQARLYAHMSYAQAAVALGKAENTIRAYELGTFAPPLPVLFDLADAYGVTVHKLLGEDNVHAA